MRLTLAGILIGALLGMTVMAQWIAPRDPDRQDLDRAVLYPGPDHPLGTDPLGRDILSRLVFGARVSLVVAVLATLLSVLIGAAVGLAAGTSGGRIDRVLMRFVDVGLAFPTLVLLLALAALFRADSPLAVVALLGATTWMPLARLVRAEALALGRQRFVEAAARLGASAPRRSVRHIAPNLISTVIISATLLAGDVILMESGLSYLGLGVPASVPTLGSMVRQGMQDLSGAWWVATFPGIALAVTVVAFNLLGDGLRDALATRAPVTARVLRPPMLPRRGEPATF